MSSTAKSGTPERQARATVRAIERRMVRWHKVVHEFQVLSCIAFWACVAGYLLIYR
jgi:hypothetical protein